MITNPILHKSQLCSTECSQLGNRNAPPNRICYNIISPLASTSSVASLDDFGRYLDKVCPENPIISAGETVYGRIITCQAFSNH